MHGTPVFHGTRVPVETLWHYLEAGDSLENFLMDFPGVTQRQAVFVLQEARKTLIASTPNLAQTLEPVVEAAP